MNHKSKILLHKDELPRLGIDIRQISLPSDNSQPPHRDDHYMFIIQSKGSSLWELDFNEIMLEGISICYVVPGQVHRYLKLQKFEGWLLFVDTSFINKEYREIFENFLNFNQSYLLQSDDDLLLLVKILQKWIQDYNDLATSQMIESLTETLVGTIAKRILSNKDKSIDFGGTKYVLATKFKQLVKQKFKKNKQVKDYAILLNITPLYLNEVAKKITGFPASYWIQKEIILEAKRLLSYTDLNITEIAYELGYEDYAYFSRFFKKNTGISPSSFKNKKP